ncbi:MAG: beta-ketoacyl synthase N-terminal-like domain-containing protein, partial [Thermocrispum sp.]
MTDPENAGNAVAVVGAACRFPGAANLAEFWGQLRAGRHALTVLPDDELLAAGVPQDDVADPDYVRAAMLMPGVHGFDAELFGLPDADRCDPQSRAFVEAAHAAVTNAGYDVSGIGDGAAVFVAARPSRYRELHLCGAGVSADVPADLLADFADAETDPAAFTSRLLDFRGPSVTIGSCSLRAVYLAAQALAAGDCDTAVAGGTRVQFPYGHGYRWSAASLRPPDGYVRPFDVAASGCVPGSGAGAIVLKRLSDAIEDGDEVRAVILGVASGHPGAGGDGAPAVIAEAMSLADCGPRDLGYIEADGAASAAADAREVSALTRGLLLDDADLPAGTIPLGSVKSNVGHLGEAAGIAGLLKVVLALRNEYLPATLNVTAAHPGLELDRSPLRLATRPAAWRRVDGTPRRAAVHAVSAGGATTAVVIEEGRTPVLSDARRRPQVVVWSAAGTAAAEAAQAELAAFFGGLSEERFADTAATLRCGRTAYPVRRAAVGGSAAEASQVLATDEVITGERPATEEPDVLFSFPGLREGAQLPIGLYGTEPAFTEAADLCLEAFERHGADVYEQWLTGRADGPNAAAVLFVAEYALAAAWRGMGVRAAAAVGVGIGEIAAAVVTEELSLDAAVEAVRTRAPDAAAEEAGVDAGSGIVLTVGPAGAPTRPVTSPATHVDSLGKNGGDERMLLVAV